MGLDLRARSSTSIGYRSTPKVWWGNDNVTVQMWNTEVCMVRCKAAVYEARSAMGGRGDLNLFLSSW